MPWRPVADLSPRVERYVRLHFGGDADRAIAELAETVPGLPLSRREDPERLAMAIVILADGDLARLQARAHDATVDWRDVLVAAGLGHEDWRRKLNAILDEPNDSGWGFSSRGEAVAVAIGWPMILAGLLGVVFFPLFLLTFVGFGLLVLRSYSKWPRWRAASWPVRLWGPFAEPHLIRSYGTAWHYVLHGRPTEHRD